MDLKDYVRVIKRNWILLCSFPLLGMLCSGALVIATPQVYTAETELFVATQNSGTVSELQVANSFSQDRVQSYVQTVVTPAVLGPVIEALALDVTPSELKTRISASAARNTVIIRIEASDSSPTRAAAIAQATADSLVTVVNDLESRIDGTSAVQLTVITPAEAPTSAASPSAVRYLALGTLLGLALGLAVVLVRNLVDTRVRNQADIADITNLPLLGGIAFDNDASKKPLLTQAPAQSPRAESFRQIRTNLQFTKIEATSNRVLVTSSLPGEGKTTTATNIAIAMAQSGQKVVLVDADLRRPMVAEYLGLEGHAGLTTALLGTAHLNELLQPWGRDDLYVLTSGQIPPNPSELLGSGAMAQLLDELARQFDLVIIDAPPLIPVTDATILSQKVGSVVVVAGLGKVRTQDLERSLSSLAMVEANVVGIVMNLMPAKGPDAYASSYYSYSANVAVSGNSRSRSGSRRGLSNRSRQAKPDDNHSTFEDISR